MIFQKIVLLIVYLIKDIYRRFSSHNNISPKIVQGSLQRKKKATCVK